MATLTRPIQSAPPAARVGSWPLVALFTRTMLFAGWQAVIAGLLALGGQAAAWDASAGWWPVTALLTNLVCIGLLAYLMRQEGSRYWDLFRLDQAHWRRDLLTVLGLTVLAVPLVLLPNFGLATLLFGDAAAPVPLMFRALPAWAIWLSILGFPVTIALAELPLYFGYAMPRLGQGWWPVLLTAFFLSIQHAALPLIFDGRFIVWRALMFSLFALMCAVALRWRPRLLPYLVVVHGLLDLQAALMLLSVR